MEAQINLSDGNGKRAFVDGMGATVTRFLWDYVAVIYPKITIATKTRGGIPICFPFFGSSPERFATEIPKHGWFRDETQELVVKQEHLAAFEGNNARQWLKTYPWKFFYDTTVAVTALDGLTISFHVQRVLDQIEELAPVNPAFHPYFSNLGARHVIIDGVEYGIDNGPAKIVPSGNLIIIDQGMIKTRMVLKGEFNRMSYLALWSENKDYFCVEPILTDPKIFATPMGRHLKVGEGLKLSMSLRPMP